MCINITIYNSDLDICTNLHLFRTPVSAFGIDILSGDKSGSGGGYKMRMRNKKKKYTPSASFDLGDDDSVMPETPGAETPDSPTTETPEMVWDRFDDTLVL